MAFERCDSINTAPFERQRSLRTSVAIRSHTSPPTGRNRIGLAHETLPWSRAQPSLSGVASEEQRPSKGRFLFEGTDTAADRPFEQKPSLRAPVAIRSRGHGANVKNRTLVVLDGSCQLVQIHRNIEIRECALLGCLQAGSYCQL